MCGPVVNAINATGKLLQSRLTAVSATALLCLSFSGQVWQSAWAQGITEAKVLPAVSEAQKKGQPKPKSASHLDSYLTDQLAREKAKHRTYYESLAKNASETGQRDLRNLRNSGAERNMPVYTPNDNSYQPMSARVPGYNPATSLPARSPVYVSQELEYAKMKEAMAQEKAAQLRKVAAEKEAGLQQSMENMKSQMKESHVPGAAVARPEGSNLFVRYYGSSSGKPYEVHPAAARIVPHQ